MVMMRMDNKLLAEELKDYFNSRIPVHKHLQMTDASPIQSILNQQPANAEQVEPKRVRVSGGKILTSKWIDYKDLSDEHKILDRYYSQQSIDTLQIERDNYKKEWRDCIDFVNSLKDKLKQRDETLKAHGILELDNQISALQSKVNEAKKLLVEDKVLDRSNKEKESLRDLVVCALNAIHWRDVEISNLQSKVDELEKAVKRQSKCANIESKIHLGVLKSSCLKDDQISQLQSDNKLLVDAMEELGDFIRCRCSDTIERQKMLDLITSKT